MNNEITSILRLNGWAGRVVLGVYGLGTTIVALLNLDGLISPVIGIVTLALFWAGLVILALPQGEPFGLGLTIAIVAIVAVGTAISAGNVIDPTAVGFATWPLGAMTFLLFVLALRGRRGLAWVGFAAIAAASIVVAMIAGQDIVRVNTDVLRQSATLIIGTLFAVVLRRASLTIASINASQLARATVAAATVAATRERDDQNALLERSARPALERIISREPFTQNDLQQFAVLAASLRGGIQPSGSSGERIAQAIRDARGRGLGVNVIDDRGIGLNDGDRSRVEKALLPLLADTNNGSITVRFSPEGRDEIATIVVEEGGRYRRVVITSAAIEVSQPVV